MESLCAEAESAVINVRKLERSAVISTFSVFLEGIKLSAQLLQYAFILLILSLMLCRLNVQKEVSKVMHTAYAKLKDEEYFCIRSLIKLALS